MTTSPGMLVPFRKLNWGWVGVNLACWLLADLVYKQLGNMFFYSNFGFLPIFGSALVIALGQWLYLRTKFKKAGWWILATTVGISLLLLASEIQTIAGAYGLAPTLLLIVSGSWVLLGLLQWLVLRTHLARAGWWILGSAVGILISRLITGLVYSLSFVILFNTDTTKEIVSLLFGSLTILGPALGYLVYGLITGFVFYRLSRKMDQEAQLIDVVEERVS